LSVITFRAYHVDEMLPHTGSMIELQPDENDVQVCNIQLLKWQMKGKKMLKGVFSKVCCYISGHHCAFATSSESSA